MNNISNNPQLSSEQVQSSKYKNVPKEYLDIAEGMETQFINHMLDELRKSVVQENPDSSAETYYKSMLDQERAQIMAKTENGLGIKDLVLSQIYPAFKNVNQDVVINKYKEAFSNKGVENE